MKRKQTLLSLVVMATMILVLLPLGLIIGCSGSNNSTGPNYGGGGGTGGGGGGPGPSEMWLQGFAFNPTSRSIAVGTTITWTNKDNATHTVTSGTPGAPDGRFNSGDMGPGAVFSHTFTTAGTYRFYCMHHTYMTGTITVQ